MIFHARTVKASRKQRTCDWCNEPILVGGPCSAYRWSDGYDSGACYMHPECAEASAIVFSEEGAGFMFTPGGFARGCTCANGDCKCNPEGERDGVL